MTQGICCIVDDGVAVITLNRPEVLNALDLPAAYAFGAAVDRAAGQDVRAVLVAGAGGRFCAGGDVASMAASDNRGALLHSLATTFDAGLRKLSQLPKPVVAAVHGTVAGAGIAILLHSDVVISAKSSKFLMGYAGMALTPDCGVSYLLPRAIGQQRALELALTGRVLTADQAHDWGLVSEVTDDDGLMARAREAAVRLAAGPTGAFAETKRLIRASWTTTREEHACDEAATIARAVTTEDAAKRLKTFLDRRS